MEYDNSEVRRQDRLLSPERAEALLATGEYGVLSMCGERGAYGLPLNYVWDGKESIYIHCATQGRKLASLAGEDRVSFCVVGRTHVRPSQFTTEYESIVLECRARTGLPADERMRALESLLAKYAPADRESGKTYAARSFHRTEIIRLDIGRWSGKCKSVH